MAGASSPEDSEPLFVLEPLPELSSVIDSFASSNPLLLIVGFASALFYLQDSMTQSRNYGPHLSVAFYSIITLQILCSML